MVLSNEKWRYCVKSMVKPSKRLFPWSWLKVVQWYLDTLRQPVVPSVPIEYVCKRGQDYILYIDKTVEKVDFHAQPCSGHITTESSVPSGQGNQMVQLLEDLNEMMAKNTDILVNMPKENGQWHEETTKSFEAMHTLLNMWHKGDGGDRPCNPSYPVMSNQGPTHREGCYYCWINGYYIADCQSLAADVKEGKIKGQDNGLRVDFKQFLKEPQNLPPKDRVALAWKNRKQFTVDEFPEDLFVNLTPTQSSIVTLQLNWSGWDKRTRSLSWTWKRKPDMQ